VRPTLYSVKRTGSGRLSTMARPRGNDWLPDEMNGLREAGADVLVSMLTSDEANDLDLQGEANAATAAGLVFLACPTADRGVPDAQTFRDLLVELKAALADGQNVVVRCRMGIGRSSLVAAGLLVSEGQTVPDAFKAISSARGMAVPDTDAQRTWLQAVMSDSGTTAP
jgi:protein-tyrosine phosphatase